MNSNLFDTYKFLEDNCKSEAADMYYALEFLEENIKWTKLAVS